MKTLLSEGSDYDRNWLSKIFYPFSLKEEFTPCCWDELNLFEWESEKFQQAITQRINWLKANNIKNQIHVQILELTDLRKVYNVWIAFKTVKDYEAYKLVTSTWEFTDHIIL